MIMVYIAAPLILVFFGLYVYIWKRVNANWVKHNGEAVLAKVTGTLSRKRGDWGVTWEVQASWQRPQDGKVFAFYKCEWLRKDPAPLLQGQDIWEVTVYIDPKDPRTHWIALDFLPPEYFIKPRNFSN